MFGVLGVVGLCWVIAWELWYRDVATTRVDSCRQIPWRLILSDSQVLLIFAMYCCYAWGSWFFMAWFPTYLIRGAGFSESQMGIFSSLPFLMGICGNIAGGVISDRLVITRGVKVGRLAVACTSLIAASLLILCLALTQNKAAIVICSSVGFGVMDLMLPVSWAVCMDIGREYSGVVTGVMNSAGQLGGFICTVTVGYILRATGSYSIPLWIISGMVIISALLFTRIDPTRPINYDEPR